jgi:hypothetical protein
MVPDPVLDAHEIAELVYLLSGPSPISLRDQMLRGLLVTQRLYGNGTDGLIHNQRRPLLVVGAGAGGITAALTAVDLGVRTQVVEVQSQPFLVQAFANTRYVDPVQYDWPLKHWIRGRFPWRASHLQMPLPFAAQSAFSLRADWDKKLTDVYKQSGPSGSRLFDIAYKTYPKTFNYIPAVSPAMPAIDVTFSTGGVERFGAVIWAAGFRPENRFAPDRHNKTYEGQPFWGPDQFQAIPNGARVLISGSGDGALQDYLRVTTQRDAARDILLQLKIPPRIQNTLLGAEDCVYRGRSWANGEGQELPYLREIEHLHVQLASDCLQSPVRNELKALFQNRPPNIKMAYKGEVLDGLYSLNRFLVVLIARFFSIEFGIQTLFPRTQIRNIQRNRHDHDCMQLHPLPTSAQRAGVKYDLRAAGQYQGEWTNSYNERGGGVLITHECFNKPHEVELWDNDTGQISAEIFDVVIVRHGLLRETGDPMPRRPKHLLPYHIPV